MKAVGKTPTDRLENAKEVVARKFGWERIDTRSQQEFYAKDSLGRIHWLKARTRVRNSMSWDGLESERQYDMLVGIFVSPEASPDADITLVVRAQKPVVECFKVNDKSGNPRLRWRDEDESLRAQVEILWELNSAGE